MQPTVGQFVAKPRSSYWHATTDSPWYGMPPQRTSARHVAASLCAPHGSPGGAGHQSCVDMPHGFPLGGPASPLAVAVAVDVVVEVAVAVAVAVGVAVVVAVAVEVDVG